MRPFPLFMAVGLAPLVACGLAHLATEAVVAPATSPPTDAGPAVIDAGAIPQLTFAVVGDTRPPFPDDTADYPAQIIGQIFEAIDGLSPRPQFVVGTGDYMSVDPVLTGELSQASAQAELYVLAAQGFRGPVYPAMGNHECTLTTASNCCPGCTDGVTPNYLAFLEDILGALRLPNQLPYYSVQYASSDPTNPWTAKFVFVAANAWDDAQSSWLATVLTFPTTYTFVVRHEPDYDNSECVGCAASDQIVKAFSYTMLLTGHEHTYQTVPSSSELIVGTGGAALNSANDQYGYALCSQLPSGNISCAEHNYDGSASSYPSAVLEVTPAGNAAN